MHKYGIAIHGGAGTILKSKLTKSKRKAYERSLSDASKIGYKVLAKGGSACSAVREAIVIMEDCPLFNAGKGSVFNSDGRIEMDAAIMDGKKLSAGAIAGVPYIKNPILLAETVMKKSNHVFLSGEQALQFARLCGLEEKPQTYFETKERYEQFLKVSKKNLISLDHDELEQQKFGTVGAVALDKKGNMAAGTSTGGMVNKRYGRIGDSPIIGIGTYANNQSCAISCTGYGEYFIRGVVAHEISARMLYKKESLSQAAEVVILEKLPSMGGRGGLIGIDRHGNICMPFNTRGMYRAYRSAKHGEDLRIFD